VADDRPYLLHIRDAIDRIRSYTHQGKEAFFTSSLLQDAVIRNLEVIGEAAKRISPSSKAAGGGDPVAAGGGHARRSHPRLLRR